MVVPVACAAPTTAPLIAPPMEVAEASFGGAIPHQVARVRGLAPPREKITVRRVPPPNLSTTENERLFTAFDAWRRKQAAERAVKQAAERAVATPSLSTARANDE